MRLILYAASGACLALAAPAFADTSTAGVITLLGVAVDGEHPAPEGLPLSTQAVSAETVDETINAVTVEDALKYLPNVFIRRRHIGDVQAPMTTRTSGLGSSARSLIYVDGVLISALIGNNNSSASPRWGMVGPDEISQVQILYGPFSAAYAGNSIGAVVNIATHDPQAFEARGSALASRQSFAAYGTQGDYETYGLTLGLGDRRGPFTWRLSLSHIETEAQPLTFVTAARPAAPSAAGLPVTGAFADANRTGQPIVVLGASAFESQSLDTVRLKLAWQPTQQVRIAYQIAYFGNDDAATAQTYLRDATGAPVYAGSLNIGGYAYSVAASAFSNGVYALDEGHVMQSLSGSWEVAPTLRIEAIANAYDYQHDLQRLPTTALPGGFTGGAGAIVDLGGTGWITGDITATWTPVANHRVRLGLHGDLYELSSNRYATADWMSGPPGALTTASRGRTRTLALWAEELWRITPSMDVTLGGRWEGWRAFDRFNFSQSPALTLAQPDREARRFSPKLVFGWRPAEGLAVTASVAGAYRFPTVSELYQVVTTGPTLSSPDPNLRAEHAVSGELSVERRWGGGSLRLSFFAESVQDALISQTGPVTPGSALTASFVQNVGEVRSAGLELAAEWRDLLPGVDVSGYATYVDSEIVSDPGFPAAVGKQTPQVPRWRGALTATWRPTDRLSLTAGARYSDRVYATLDNSDTVTHTYQGFDPYLIIDLRARWRVTNRVSLAVGVDNAGNRDYILFHPFPQRSVLIELQAAY